MKKIISLTGVALVLVIAMLAVSLTGCGTTNTDTQKDKGQVSGTVATDGSTSMEKVIGFLSEAYMEENSAVKVT